MNYSSAELSFFNNIKQISINEQSLALPNNKKGESDIYVHPVRQDWDRVYDSVKNLTLLDVFENTVKKFSDKPFLGNIISSKNPVDKPTVTYLTYTEVHEKVNRIRRGLYHLLQSCPNFQSGQQDLDYENENRRLNSVGILGRNRKEWIITDFACMGMSVASVGLFDTMNQEQLEYVINETETQIIVCDGCQIYKLLRTQSDLPNLKYIISMDELKGSDDPKHDWAYTVLDEWAKSKGIQILDFKELEELGLNNPRTFQRPRPDDIYMLCYTSGTTGMPKGAELSHQNALLPTFFASQKFHAYYPDIEFSTLSYMPLSHVYEKSSLFSGLWLGTKISFWRNDPRLLVEDLSVAKPAFLSAVPRVLNRIYSAIMTKVEQGNPLIATIFKHALNTKINDYRQGLGVKHAFWDTIIFSKLRKLLGGNLVGILSGSASIKPNVLEGLSCMLSVFTVEGYGATETAAGATMTLIQDYTTGHVGPPIVCCDIKFKDVPEMNYINTPNQPQGEICIRGPHVFKNYYKNIQKYKECFDEDGFYLSGDIGVLTDDKAIKIVDRKSNIIKLSQGEFVSLESLEGTYLECDLLLMGWVYGDGLKSSLVSILVVNPDTFLPWARSISPSQMSIEELCNSDLVKTQVLIKLNEIASKHGLKKYEFIKVIHLEPQPFSPENGLITPTLKVKRKNLKQYYQLKLDEMYKSIGQ